jgi:hypothetical protein
MSVFKFKTISTITAIVAFILFLLLLLAPEIIFILFQVQGGESAFFISRRAAMLFMGIAAFSWIGRNAVHSESRQAICVGLSISMLALAMLGIIEFARGFTGGGIFFAIITEVTLGVAYFKIWAGNKNS